MRSTKVFLTSSWLIPGFPRTLHCILKIIFIAFGVLLIRVMFSEEFKDQAIHIKEKLYFLTDKLSVESWNSGDNYKQSKPTTFPPGLNRSTWTQEYRDNTCYSDWQKNYEKFHKETLDSWNKKKGGRFLVYRCREHECSFGYGNRMRSLISVFYMALLTDRAFLVDWTSPSRLDKYLDNNRISWNYSLGHHHKNFRLNFWASYRLKHYRPIVEKRNLSSYFKHKVEIIRGLPYSLIYQLSANPYVSKIAAKFGFPLDVLSSQYKAVGCAFHFLFKLNKGMQNKLNRLTKVMGYNNNIMMSIHIRAGDAISFFKKSRDLRISKGNLSKIFSCVHSMKYAIQTVYNTTRVSMFLASDAWDIKEVVRKEYPDIFQYRGSIQHIGHNKQKLLTDARNPSGDDMETIIIEQFLMAKCDFHFHSHSSFSGISQGMAFGTRENAMRLPEKSFECVLPSKLQRNVTYVEFEHA